MDVRWILGLELVVVVHALLSLLAHLQRWPGHMKSLVVTLLVLALPLALGGTMVLPTAVKVLSFMLMLQFGLRLPRAALGWLCVWLALEIGLNAAAGNLGGKLGAVPILLTATLWLGWRGYRMSTAPIVLIVALLAETLQSVWLGMRGSLLGVAIVTLVYILPTPRLPRLLPWIMLLLPLLTPLLMLFAAFSLIAGLELIEPTASNVERSTLAAWCVVNVPAYPWVGPGIDSYMQETSAFITLLERTPADDMIDPHAFLLSAWLWIGTGPALFLYIQWAAVWWRFGIGVRKRRASKVDQRLIRALLSCATLVLLIFMLSPPSSAQRIQVALVSGFVLARMTFATRSASATRNAITTLQPSMSALAR